MEAVDRNVGYAAMIPGYIPPTAPRAIPHLTPESVHTVPLFTSRETERAIPERDISSPSLTPTFPLIHPPTYNSVQTIAPPPPYTARRRTYSLRWNPETRQYKKDRFGWLTDYRCLAMTVALIMFSIVVVVFVVLNKMGKRSK